MSTRATPISNRHKLPTPRSLKEGWTYSSSPWSLAPGTRTTQSTSQTVPLKKCSKSKGPPPLQCPIEIILPIESSTILIILLTNSLPILGTFMPTSSRWSWWNFSGTKSASCPNHHSDHSLGDVIPGLSEGGIFKFPAFQASNSVTLVFHDNEYVQISSQCSWTYFVWK